MAVCYHQMTKTRITTEVRKLDLKIWSLNWMEDLVSLGAFCTHAGFVLYGEQMLFQVRLEAWYGLSEGNRESVFKPLQLSFFFLAVKNLSDPKNN